MEWHRLGRLCDRREEWANERPLLSKKAAIPSCTTAATKKSPSRDFLVNWSVSPSIHDRHVPRRRCCRTGTVSLRRTTHRIPRLCHSSTSLIADSSCARKADALRSQGWKCNHLFSLVRGISPLHVVFLCVNFASHHQSFLKSLPPSLWVCKLRFLRIFVHPISVITSFHSIPFNSV